jgi:hypothetical protein
MLIFARDERKTSTRHDVNMNAAKTSQLLEISLILPSEKRLWGTFQDLTRGKHLFKLVMF